MAFRNASRLLLSSHLIYSLARQQYGLYRSNTLSSSMNEYEYKYVFTSTETTSQPEGLDSRVLGSLDPSSLALVIKIR